MVIFVVCWNLHFRSAPLKIGIFQQTKSLQWVSQCLRNTDISLIHTGILPLISSHRPNKHYIINSSFTILPKPKRVNISMACGYLHNGIYYCCTLTRNNLIIQLFLEHLLKCQAVPLNVTVAMFQCYGSHTWCSWRSYSSLNLITSYTCSSFLGINE